MGLASRTLTPLIAGTAVILGVATWGVYARSVDADREAALAALEDRAAERTRREDEAFARVERQLRHAHLLLEQRWERGDPGTPPPPEGEGGRKELPAPGAPPLAVFIADRAVGDAAVLRAAGVARDLLAELGPGWCEGLAGMAIAAPGGWLAGWGEDKVALVDDMLPGDPVVLRDEQELVAAHGEPVRWSGAWLEPASGRRFVSAATAPALAGLGRVIITQTLPVDAVLERAAVGQPAGTRTVVFDRLGHVLAGGDDIPPAVRALAAPGPAVERRYDAATDAWLAVSRLQAPGWAMVTIQPAAVIEARARRRAGVIMVGGLALLAAQVALLVVLLRRGVARPLRRLVDAAGRLADGERGVALEPARGDEIGDLSRAFARMDQAVAAGEEGLRRALATVREREEFARALVDSAADAVVVLGADGTLLDANPRAAALFGVADGAALRGRPLAGLAPTAQRDGSTSAEVLAGRIAAARAGAAQQFPWQAQRHGGVAFDAEIGLTRVDLPGDERLLAVIRDVTERNRFEEHLRQAQKLESVGQLAGGVAHDFNNMLAGIMGAAELLMREATPPERRRELADSILVSCERAAGLTRRLLDFARKGHPSQALVDVHRVVREMVALVERTLDRRIRLEVDLRAVRRTVVGDAAQLQNALLNLVLNARDAMPQGGRLRLDTAVADLGAAEAARLHGVAAPGAHLVVTVADDGTGIPPEALPRIFEPFFTTKPVGKGTGLGLTAVHRAVCDHRGGIAVESAYGRGTAFSLWLPLAPAEATEERTPSPVPTATRAATVLVVDDEEIVRTLAASMLEVLGYRALTAIDGLDAIAVFRADPDGIDLIMLDSEMPGLRGRDCLRRLRLLAPRLPAVLCSGFADEATPDELAREGIVAVVQKPFRLHDLARAMTIALAARGG